MIRVLPIVNGVVTADFVGGNNSFKIFVSQDCTFQFSNPRQAQVAFVLFQQDSTGGHTVTFASNIKNVQYTESGANQTASIRFQYDDTSNSWYATAATSTIAQPSNVIFVDGTRTDTYVPNGTIGLPFKTIMGAVNQVIANGDNSYSTGTDQVPYFINIIGPDTYNETIDLSDSHLVNLFFTGYGGVFVFGSGGTNPALKCVGNPGMQVLNFTGMTFFGGAAAASAKAIDLEDGSNSGTFLAVGGTFIDCTFQSSVTDGIYCKNTVSLIFQDCDSGTPSNWTIDGSSGGGFVNFRDSSISVGGTFALKNGAFLEAFASRIEIAITIDATSTLSGFMGSLMGALSTPITVNGTYLTQDAITRGDITVNNGGSAQVSGIRQGALTVNAGGTYTPASTVETHIIGLQNSQMITTGTGSPEGAVTAVVGSLYLRTNGGTNTTLYVKESGTGNTGWAAK